ncbi:sulfatase-like hydrolase/transferase [Saccharicrinis sp. GN24d3]|uniref:sulfatase-like hydrolase/transferase n=1 Tax=Saccharicrinis sp. GN24d3 TaxID=3458416 RepID=UPI004036C4F1
MIKNLVGFILLSAIFLSLIGSSCAKNTKLSIPPNVVVIMADDLGYADVGYNGCKDIPTPHIDKLAESGAIFSSGYVSGPMCGPSRAGFITGRIQSSFGWYGNPGAPLDERQGLPATVKTVASYMQEQGYVTGGVGKWHMGTAPHQHPNKMGYDHWYGFLSGGHLYFPMDHPSYNGKYTATPKPWGMRDMHHTMPMIHNDEPIEWDQYLTHELTDLGVTFIEKHKDKPFFLFMSYNAPHEYMEAPEETMALFSPEDMTHIPGVKPDIRSIYAAMTYEFDKGVGALTETLQRLNLAENTIVWFLSDNGGMKRTSDNRPLRGAKWSSYEGGLRVPFVVSWPGHIEPGTVLDAPVTTLDIGATSVALAGGNLSKTNLDGADITPYFTGQSKDAPHEELFWRIGRNYKEQSGVLRVGDYKLIVQKEKVQLFNLKEDLAETNDLSQSQPERAQQMLGRWKELDQYSLPPSWENLPKGDGNKDEYQYKDYEWLKGSPHYRGNEK